MYISNLGGHSGCKILLCETEDNTTFVRKISKGHDYNQRLSVQAEKQKIFCSDTIEVPDVFATGYTEEGLFYFDMEYIGGGITLAEYMKTIEIGKVRGLVEKLVNNFVLTSSNGEYSNEIVFCEKIKSLQNKLSDLNNSIVDDAIDVLSHHSWTKFTKTACHGDLTLENIIVKDHQLYLIDFLDSFYDSWIMDIATLLQDVQTMWSYRFEDELNINTLLRLIVFRDILMDEVTKTLGRDSVEVYYALLLKLIRIYPYIKDKKTYQFLNTKTASVLNIIREGC